MTAHKTRERDQQRTDPTTMPDVNFNALSRGDVIEVGDQFYDHVNAKWVVVSNDQAGQEIGMKQVSQWRRQVNSFIGGGFNDTIEVPDHYVADDGTDQITGSCPASSEGAECTDACQPAVIKLGNILHEADKLVHGDRGNDYGSPREDFERTAKLMSAVLGTSVTAEQVPLLMMCVKLSRQCHKPKRDNLVDIAGYAETAGMLEEE